MMLRHLNTGKAQMVKITIPTIMHHHLADLGGGRTKAS